MKYEILIDDVTSDAPAITIIKDGNKAIHLLEADIQPFKDKIDTILDDESLTDLLLSLGYSESDYKFFC